jgi:hypothetical protein
MDTEEDIKKILTDDEEIIFVARQSRIMPGGSMTTPNAIYATNKRIIFRDPSLLGLKTKYNDVNYSDVGDVRMEKGLFTTQIFLKSKILSDPILIPAVDKKDAEQINQVIREGIEGALPNQVVSDQKTGLAVTAAKAVDPLEQLKELKKLKDSDAITKEDYEKKKQELLDKIN